MTIDLMKQMTGICEAGEKLSINDADKAYYSALRNNLYDAIDLLYLEPVIENK